MLAEPGSAEDLNDRSSHRAETARAQVTEGGGEGVGEAEEAVTVDSPSRRLAGNVDS